MKKELLLNVKNGLENIISDYKVIIDNLTEHQKKCNDIRIKLQEKAFKLYNQEKYLEWEKEEINKNEINVVENYYEGILRKVFKKLSFKILELLFKTCKNKRDINDFEKLMEFNLEKRAYPYLLSLRFCNSTIETYLHNGYNQNINFKYYNSRDIHNDIWNSNKGKWEDIILYENFEKHIESDYFKNYNEEEIKEINYNIKDVIKEYREFIKLQKKQKEEIENLQKKQKEEIEKFDKFGIVRTLK